MKLRFKKWIACVFFGGNLLIGAPPVFLTNQDRGAERTLSSLTLREKIGQLFGIAVASCFDQPTESLASSMRASPYKMDIPHVEKMITEYHVAGVVFLYKSDPKAQVELTQKLHQKAKIPLLITQDSEWGLAMRLDLYPEKVVRYPHNMTLGAIQDKALIFKMGYEIGKECSALGVHMNFAPVADVNNNPQNPVIHDRSFGDDPERVAQLSIQYAQGLQQAGIFACAKHFPGHGDTAVDSHLDLPIINQSRDRLDTLELYPFKKLINEGIPAIMNAHLSIPVLGTSVNEPSSMSSAVVTGLLKNSLGFTGLIITDGLGMEAITKHYEPGEIELQAFLAGNDILLCPLDVPKAIDLIEVAIKEGKISPSELDRRVLKILQAKAWAFAQHASHAKNIHNPLDYIIRPEAYALQSTLYQRAMTVAKNKLGSFNETFLADSALIQIGSLPENAFVKACERAVKNIAHYSADFSHSEMEACLKAAKNCSLVLISLGQMNKSSHKKFGIADNTFTLIQQLQQQGKKVGVIIFGTPYSVPSCKAADMILVAYEDVIPAQAAAAQVLLGQVHATGRLPVHIDL